MQLIKNLILTAFCLIFSFHSVAQKRKKIKKTIQYPFVKVIGKDTITMLTMNHIREINQKDIQRMESMLELNHIESKLKFKDSIILMQETKIADLLLIKYDYDLVVKEIAREKRIYNENLIELNSEIIKQRKHKRIAICSGVLSLGTILYFYIHK